MGVELPVPKMHVPKMHLFSGTKLPKTTRTSMFS